MAEMDRHYDVDSDLFMNDMEQDNYEVDSYLAELLERCGNNAQQEANCSQVYNTTSTTSLLVASRTDSGNNHAFKKAKIDELKKTPIFPMKTIQEYHTANSSSFCKDSGVYSDICTWSISKDKDQDKTLWKKYKGGKFRRKRKREYVYNPKPVQEKKSKMIVPENCKTQDYWKKRLRNNDASKKSRELRRKKELEVREDVSQLRHENETLRKEIASAQKLNKAMNSILAEYEKYGFM